MVSSLKNITLFAQEIMHYHKSLINFLKQKNDFVITILLETKIINITLLIIKNI